MGCGGSKNDLGLETQMDEPTNNIQPEEAQSEQKDSPGVRYRGGYDPNNAKSPQRQASMNDSKLTRTPSISLIGSYVEERLLLINRVKNMSLPTVTHDVSEFPVEQVVKMFQNATTRHLKKVTTKFFKDILALSDSPLKACHVDVGSCLFNQGDVATGFYFLVEGVVQCSGTTAATLSEPPRPWTSKVTPGGFFGEVSLILDEPRTGNADVVSENGATFLFLDPNAFAMLLHEPEIVAAFELKLGRRFATLSATLHHTEGITQFRRYLATEHASEGIEFWSASQKYTKMCRNNGAQPMTKAALAENMARVATTLYDIYIAPDSEKTINISKELRDSLKEDVEQKRFTHKIFAKPMQEVRNMLSEAFFRFRESSTFQHVLDTTGSYQEVDVSVARVQESYGALFPSAAMSFMDIRSDSMSLARRLPVGESLSMRPSLPQRLDSEVAPELQAEAAAADNQAVED